MEAPDPPEQPVDSSSDDDSVNFCLLGWACALLVYWTLRSLRVDLDLCLNETARLVFQCWNVTLWVIHVQLYLINILTYFYIYHDPNRETVFGSFDLNHMVVVLLTYLVAMRELYAAPYSASVSKTIADDIAEEPYLKFFRFCHIDIFCDGKEELEQKKLLYQASCTHWRFRLFPDSASLNAELTLVSLHLPESSICPLCREPCEPLRMNEHHLTGSHQQMLLNVFSSLLPPVSIQHANPAMTIQRTHSLVALLANRLRQMQGHLRNADRQFGSNANSYRVLTRASDSLEAMVEETADDLALMRDRQTWIRAELQLLEQQHTNNQIRAVDGTFVWKISDLRQGIDDAQSERQRSIYSPPFYSSPTGYQMCSRLYLTAVDSGRGTHLSVFFILMRNEYDALLPWPFSHRVIISLLDQSSDEANRQHFSRSFWPDSQSESFQRPRSARNIGYGFAQFFSLNQLKQNGNQYVQNDTIFLKIEIDFIGEPSELQSDAAQMLEDDDQHTGTNDEDLNRLCLFPVEN